MVMTRPSGRKILSICFLGGFLALNAACTSGPLNVSEQYYLVAENDESRNYYRITVEVDTMLSEAQFRQGWYPEFAVDQLFGAPTAENAGEGVKTREELKKLQNAALIELRRQYIEELKNGRDKDKLTDILQAQARLRLSPTELNGSLSETVVSEYNPGSSLVTRRDGEKLVLFLSANPDEIIQKIKSISDQAKTQASLSKFVDAMVFSTKSEKRKEENRYNRELLSDKVISAQIEIALQSIESASDDSERINAIAALEALQFAIRQEIESGAER